MSVYGKPCIRPRGSNSGQLNGRAVDVEADVRVHSGLRRVMAASVSWAAPTGGPGRAVLDDTETSINYDLRHKARPRTAVPPI